MKKHVFFLMIIGIFFISSCSKDIPIGNNSAKPKAQYATFTPGLPCEPKQSNASLHRSSSQNDDSKEDAIKILEL